MALPVSDTACCPAPNPCEQRHYGGGGIYPLAAPDPTLPGEGIISPGAINGNVPVWIKPPCRKWHYGLFYTCRDYQSCCEACFCTPCQLSRQCNMLAYRIPQIYWPYCLLISCTDSMLACHPTCLAAAHLRTTIRRRYGIRGTECSDLCAAWLCRCCVVQQILLEMTSMNEFPGASCYTCPKIPVACTMS